VAAVVAVARGTHRGTHAPVYAVLDRSRQRAAHEGALVPRLWDELQVIPAVNRRV
jgi:hypothetical protein